jgi:Flp pilus assembly protein TadD
VIAGGATGAVVDTGRDMTIRTSAPGKSATGPQAWATRALLESPIAVLLALVAVLVAPVVACTSVAGRLHSLAITPEELLAGALLGVAQGAPASVVEEKDVLAPSAEMREFLNTHVHHKGAESTKLHELVSAIIDTDTFGVVYDDTTRTASETFRVRRGNCLSFANMFVAMARDVGLKVEYQEVDIPPDWTLDAYTYVLNQHVNVFVDLGLMGKRVVDFNIGDFKASYEMHKVSDARALAHYYNNIGVERMFSRDTAAALSCFRRALANNDRQFSPAWTNLGTLYLRNGHPAHAEAAYLEALKASASDLVAMSDLARLYERLGDRERAEAYRKKVAYHRSLNPYYRYELARRAYQDHSYDVAIGHLKYAIRKRPKEDQFYFLLGASYLRKGDEPAARRWLARAEELAATDALKRRYSDKIDMLLSPGSKR